MLVVERNRQDIKYTVPYCYNPFELATNNKKFALYKYIALGGDVNIVNSEGISLLMHCCLLSNHEYISKLLSYNPDIDYRDSNGRTALFYSIYNRDIISISYLVGYGASIDIEDNQGITPFSYSIQLGLRGIVSYLTDSKSNYVRLYDTLYTIPTSLNSVNYYGETALLHAVIIGDVEWVRYLLNNNSDCTIQSDKGITPLMASILLEDTTIFDILIAYNSHR